jgi:transcriptional regulator with XRE-family HTH domain
MHGPGADAIYREIGRAVNQLRNRRNPKMSQKMLAETVGVSRASIANIERGHHRVQLHVLYDIATALDVEPHDLMPHPDRQSPATNLPEEMSKELNPRERAAVDRLLRSGPQRDATNEKP